MVKNRNWGEINKLEGLNLDQNSKGWPRLPALKQDSSEFEIDHFKKRLNDIKKTSGHPSMPPRPSGRKPPLSRRANEDFAQYEGSERGHTDRLMAKSQQIIQNANQGIQNYQERLSQLKRPLPPLDIPKPAGLNRSRSG